MANETTVKPTIIERGALYSRGVLDYAANALIRVKQQFTLPALRDSVLETPLERAQALRNLIFGLLDTVKARLDLHREQHKKISQQIENGTSRYDDLPQPGFSFRYFGPSKDVDWIRQKILEERARLQEEIRNLEQRYWADILDIKSKVAEALTEYVELSSRLKTLTDQPVFVPAFADLFIFLDAPEPEEVVIINKPDTLDEPLPLLVRVP
jgi:hypothetical protein